jgi:hypothetical protein
MDQKTRGCNITKCAWRTIQSKVLPTKGYHKWGIIHKGRSVGGREIYAPAQRWWVGGMRVLSSGTDMLSSGMYMYHMGWKGHHLGEDVIIWDGSVIILDGHVIIWDGSVIIWGVGVIIWVVNVIIWDGNVIIWGYMISFGMRVLSPGW